VGNRTLFQCCDSDFRNPGESRHSWEGEVVVLPQRARLKPSRRHPRTLRTMNRDTIRLKDAPDAARQSWCDRRQPGGCSTSRASSIFVAVSFRTASAFAERRESDLGPIPWVRVGFLFHDHNPRGGLKREVADDRAQDLGLGVWHAWRWLWAPSSYNRPWPTPWARSPGSTCRPPLLRPFRRPSPRARTATCVHRCVGQPRRPHHPGRFHPALLPASSELVPVRYRHRA